MTDLTPVSPVGPSRLLLGVVGTMAGLLVVGLAGLGYLMANPPAASAPAPLVATPTTAPTLAPTATVPVVPTRPPTATPYVVKEATPVPASPSATATGVKGSSAPVSGLPAPTATVQAAGGTSSGDMPQTGADQMGLVSGAALVMLAGLARVLRLSRRA